MTTAQREKTLDEAAIDVERARRNAKRVVDAEEQPPHPPLRALTLDELFQLPPPSYLIDQFIPALGLVQVVGEPGACKTFFMLHASLAIASGQESFFGFPVVQHGPVLYIAAEGASALQFRVRAWCTAHDVDPLSLSDTFRVINMPVNFRDPTFQQELRAIVDEMHPILIVPDTRARCTPGADENSSKDMGEVVNFCSQLQQTAAAVAFIHHPTKKDPSGGGRGSGDRPRPEAIGAALLRRWAGQICLSWTVPTGVNSTRARRDRSPAQQYRRPLLHKGTVQPSGGAGVMWKFGEQYPSSTRTVPGTVPHESYPRIPPL